MAIIDVTISLIVGDNFISFPAISNYTFGNIFRDSGMIDNVVTLLVFDAIEQNYKSIEIESNYIEEGKGYLLQTKSTDTSILPIRYSGEAYTITFDQLIPSLLRGWNLVGTGSNILVVQNWCKIIDPASTPIPNMPVTQLEPNKAYFVNFDDCLRPAFGVGSTVTFIGAVGTILFTIYLMREFKIYPFNK